MTISVELRGVERHDGGSGTDIFITERGGGVERRYYSRVPWAEPDTMMNRAAIADAFLKRKATWRR